MEKASTIGTAVGFLAVMLGLLLAGGSVGSLFQVAALVVVIGATCGATLVSHTPSEISAAVSRVSSVFREEVPGNQAALIEEIVRVSGVVRKEGLLGAEALRAELGDPFLRRLLKLVTDGLEAPAIREAADGEIRSAFEEDEKASRVFESAGTYAPSAGVLGAIAGLVPVLSQLEDPSGLGEGIASAFVATIYGLVLSNLVFLPWAAKLRRRAELREAHLELVKAGVLGILEGISPHFLEAKMKALSGRAS